MQLHQKTLLEKRTFFLLPNKLKINLKSTKGEYENYLAYESLKGEAQVCCRQDSNLLFLTMASLTFAVCTFLHTIFTNQDLRLTIVPVIVAISLAIIYKTKQQKYIKLETFDRQKVIFLYNNPNRRALEKFLSQLWVKRRKYLRDKYFYISQSHEIQQQTDRLRWLLEQNIITQAEFRIAQEDWIIDRTYQS